jgi:hypothetical protein
LRRITVRTKDNDPRHPQSQASMKSAGRSKSSSKLSSRTSRSKPLSAPARTRYGSRSGQRCSPSSCSDGFTTCPRLVGLCPIWSRFYD